MTNDSERTSVIAKIGRLAHETMGGDDLTAFLTYVDAFFPPRTPDDLLENAPEMLFDIALMAWQSSETRQPGEPLVKLVPAKDKSKNWGTKFLAILIVNDDMPFLVDSITGGLSSTMGLRIHMMHHPLIQVVRDENGRRILGATDNEKCESVMFIEVDPQADVGVRNEIEDTVRAILSDVRAAVQDWRAMLAKIDETVASLTVNPPPISQEEVDETILFLRWVSQNHFTFLGFREHKFSGDPETHDFSSHIQ